MIFGALAAVLVCVAPPPPADAAPLPDGRPGASLPASETYELSTPRFRIVHTARAKGAALVLAEQIEAVRDDIARLLGRDWPTTTELRLGFGRDEYEALALPGGRPPSWAVALAYPAANVVLIEAHSLVQGDGQLTLRHELVHVGLGQLGQGWPRWFQEGLAQELTGERKFRLTQFTTLTRAVTQDRIFHFEELADGFPQYPGDVEIAYAQSVAFVEFLRARHGPWAFRQLIDRVQAGDNFEKAFGIAFHASLFVEEKAFREELPRRFPWWPLLFSDGTLLWWLTSLLVVWAWARRRRVVRALRAEQLRVETLQEAAKALLDAPAANDEPAWDAALEHREPPLPWRVTAVRVLELGPKPPSPDAAPAPARRT